MVGWSSQFAPLKGPGGPILRPSREVGKGRVPPHFFPALPLERLPETTLNGVRRNTSQSDQTGKSFLLMPRWLVKTVLFPYRLDVQSSANELAKWRRSPECWLAPVARVPISQSVAAGWRSCCRVRGCRLAALRRVASRAQPDPAPFPPNATAPRSSDQRSAPSRQPPPPHSWAQWSRRKLLRT